MSYVKNEFFFQPHSFDGLGTEFDHPSDVDGFYYCGMTKDGIDRGFVFLESKYYTAFQPWARKKEKQYFAIRHLIDCLSQVVPCILITVEHYTPKKQIVIEASSTLIEVYYGYKNVWRPKWDERKNITLQEYWNGVILPYKRGEASLTARL